MQILCWIDSLNILSKSFGIKISKRITRQNYSSNTAEKWKAAREVWDVYRKVENLSIIYSAFNFLGYAFNAVKKRM